MERLKSRGTWALCTGHRSTVLDYAGVLAAEQRNGRIICEDHEARLHRLHAQARYAHGDCQLGAPIRTLQRTPSSLCLEIPFALRVLRVEKLLKRRVT